MKSIKIENYESSDSEEMNSIKRIESLRKGRHYYKLKISWDDYNSDPDSELNSDDDLPKFDRFGNRRRGKLYLFIYATSHEFSNIMECLDSDISNRNIQTDSSWCCPIVEEVSYNFHVYGINHIEILDSNIIECHQINFLLLARNYDPNSLLYYEYFCEDIFKLLVKFTIQEQIKPHYALKYEDFLKAFE